MAKKAKNNFIRVRLKSSESGHAYYTKRNRKNTPDKFEFMKYDPFVRKHVLYKESGKV